jgi:response regulator RpfG family c-di-GMP phosphodiesterase
VIAEGVSSEAQLAYLQRHRCDEIQGYYFSEPITAQAFARMQQQGKTLSHRADPEAIARQTLLILDDDPEVVAALKHLLRHDDYHILSALRPAEAFELLALHQVQVIICDQRMPLMKGTDFLVKVKDMHPDTIRIIMSSRTGLASVIDAINRGAVYRFISKPWKDEALLNDIREAFQHHWLLHRPEVA